LRLSGARVVYDVHEDVPKQLLSKPWLPKAARAPLSRLIAGLQYLLTRGCYNAIVAATPSIATQFPTRMTEIVQNFPLLGELGSSTRDSVPMRDRPPEVLYVGAISRIRGVIENVTAAGLLENKDARLILAGTFDAPGLEEEARALPGWSRVDYLGHQPRQAVAARMARARAGIVLFLPEPNHVEAQPNKMFEYMSAGLPVIASDFPLWRQIIDGAGCGIVVDPEDPVAIAKAIDWILTHPDEAEAMGKRGQQAVQEVYNWQAEEKKLLALYERILA
jgi:glycosyltransferase involved in cell wall biosynthesis